MEFASLASETASRRAGRTGIARRAPSRGAAAPGTAVRSGDRADPASEHAPEVPGTSLAAQAYDLLCHVLPIETAAHLPLVEVPLLVAVKTVPVFSAYYVARHGCTRARELANGPFPGGRDPYEELSRDTMCFAVAALGFVARHIAGHLDWYARARATRVADAARAASAVRAPFAPPVPPRPLAPRRRYSPDELPET